jgi:predicted dehydrogenase
MNGRMDRPVRVALLGTSFMGRAHSNAWSQAARFFPAHPKAQLAVVCGRDPQRTEAFARQWGWGDWSCDWRAVIARDDIDVIDIALPTHLHHPTALAAAAAGKHIVCEKPMALSLAQAEEMCEAAERAGVLHYVNHNYRRVPAVQLAKRLIDAGRLGRIFHWRAAYQQDWIVDPTFPLTWHLRRETAGAGPHADLNSHSVDLAHYLVGDITSVSCLTSSFIAERPLPGRGAATFSAGDTATTGMGPVTVEDAALMQVVFSQGALGSFEATRFAPGRRNRNHFEIYGAHGSLTFDLERLNELAFYDHRDPPGEQGFRTILATEASHPYMAQWWPSGHIIGYEHTFVHAVADVLEALSGGASIAPSFRDGVKVMAVLDAGLRSAASGARLPVRYPQASRAPQPAAAGA